MRAFEATLAGIRHNRWIETIKTRTTIIKPNSRCNKTTKMNPMLQKGKTSR